MADETWHPGKPLRIIPGGDVAAATEWIPFARRKMVELSRRGDYARRTWEPAPGVVIRGEMLSGIPRVFIEAGGYEYITIGKSFSGVSDVRGLHAGKFGPQSISKKVNEWLNVDWSGFGLVDGYSVGKNLLPIGGGVFITDYDLSEVSPIYCAVVTVSGTTVSVKLLATGSTEKYTVSSILNANYGGRFTTVDDAILPRYEYLGWGGKSTLTYIDDGIVGSYAGLNPATLPGNLPQLYDSSPTPYEFPYTNVISYTSTKLLNASITIGGFSGNIGSNPVPIYAAYTPLISVGDLAIAQAGMTAYGPPGDWVPTGENQKVWEGPMGTFNPAYEFKLSPTKEQEVIDILSGNNGGTTTGGQGADFDELWLATANTLNWRLSLDVNIDIEKVSFAPRFLPEDPKDMPTDTIFFDITVVEKLRYISRDPPTVQVTRDVSEVAPAVKAIRVYSTDPATLDTVITTDGLTYHNAATILYYPPLGMEVVEFFDGPTSDTNPDPRRTYRLRDSNYDFDGRYDITVAGISGQPISARVSDTCIAILTTTNMIKSFRALHAADGHPVLGNPFYNSPPWYTPDQTNTRLIISITSNDDGMSWHANVMEMPTNRPGFSCLTYAGNGTLLAVASVVGGDGYEIWRSTDRGVTYSPVATLALNYDVSYAVCMDTGVVGFYTWRSSGGAFWRTLDFGSTWQKFTIPVFDPEQPELGGSYEYPYVQFDNRITIVKKGTTYATTVLALSIYHPIPTTPTIIEMRVFLSKDGGETWHEDAQLQPRLWGANIGPVTPNVRGNSGVPGYPDAQIPPP